ncbi:uncharacterized protein [Euwallacea fornicatus]|uniref:uncharacterized protein n=1 Tax=Euwallacea fornicatus TaxID=995702 RepID=UPI00338F1798
MTTTIPILSNSSVTAPWKFLGSASSVSPVSFLEGDLSTSTPKSQESYNGTGYYIDDDGESMWNDLKTVFLACLATLVPLIITLVGIFGMRILWVQYKTRKKGENIDGDVVQDNNTEGASKPLHAHLLNDKGSEETHIDINTDTVEICESAPNGNRSSNVNGSIITMTLKNNHLIVETEERNDIEEDSRETTMRYSPSARDGVFVVEVQQGVRRSPGSGPASIAEPEKSGSLSDECALVHNPPERYSDEETLEEGDDSEYYADAISPKPILSQPKTGLASSITSLGSYSYSYSNQCSYDQGSYGYNLYLGYSNDSTSSGRIPEDTKPKITSALYKSNTAKTLKSMSFDCNNERLKERLVLGQNSSLDNVLESNGLEEFSPMLYNKTRGATEERPSVSE